MSAPRWEEDFEPDFGEEDRGFENPQDRRNRLERQKVRDLVARRLLEAFIVFQLKTQPPFRTCFERIRVETDQIVVERLLFSKDQAWKLQHRLDDLQKRLGLSGAEHLPLRDAIADAMPDWRRGSVMKNEKRRHAVETEVVAILEWLTRLPEVDRKRRLEHLARPIAARTLVFEGALCAEEIVHCAPTLANRDGMLRPTAFEALEEVRYRVLRFSTGSKLSANSQEAA